MEELGRSHLMDEDFHKGRTLKMKLVQCMKIQELKLHHG